MAHEEGILTPLILRRALFAFSQMSMDDQKDFLSLTQTFLTDDDTATVGRALLIKALACNQFNDAIFTAFSNNLHAYNARAMLNMTTLTEIDPLTDTDQYDQWGLRQGNQSHTSAKNNDGAKQSFSISCVPASVLMYKGEINPIYALSVHEHGYDAPIATQIWSSDQASLLHAAPHWKKWFIKPKWRINELLLNHGELVPLTKDLYKRHVFNAYDYAALLQQIIDYSGTREELASLKKCAETELSELQASTPQLPAPAKKSIFSLPFLDSDPEPVDYGNLAITESFQLYENGFRALLAEKGFLQENGWNLMDLFDVEQFGMKGSSPVEVFLPENTGDAPFKPGGGILQSGRAHLVSLLATGQDVILGWPNHATLATDVRLKNGALEVYNADPIDGTATWLPLKAIPDSTEFYYPQR